MMSGEHDDNDELDDLFSFGTSSRKDVSNDLVSEMNNDINSSSIYTENNNKGIETMKLASRSSNLVENNNVHGDNQEGKDSTNRRGEVMLVSNGHDVGSRDFLEWLDTGGTNRVVEEAAIQEDIVAVVDDSSSEIFATATTKESDTVSPKDESFDFEADIWGERKTTTTESDNKEGTMEGQQQPERSLTTHSSTDSSSSSSLANSDTDAIDPTAILDGKEENDRISASNIEAPPSTPASPMSFSSLNSALLAPECTAAQLRHLFNSTKDQRSTPDHNNISAKNRKHLYVKLLCNNKNFDEVQSSSLAFSYMEWSSSNQQQQQQLDGRFHEQATILSQELYNDDEERQKLFYSDLVSLLTFYYLRTDSNNNNNRGSSSPFDDDARFIPTVTAILLFILESAPVTSVVLQSFLHLLVPILPLTSKEQVDAAQHLAKHLYLLCLFHIPVVVMHLDRYLPGWYCPKIITLNSSGNNGDDDAHDRRYKNLDTKGVVPLSWFIAYFAGSPTANTMDSSDDNKSKCYCSVREGGFPLKYLIHLWDMVLLQPEGRLMSSLKFFVALQILEQRAHEIMQIRDSDMLQEFLENHAFTHLSMIKNDILDASSTVTMDDDGVRHIVYDITNKALALQESTPVSFLSQLSTLDDAVVRTILRERERLTLFAIKDQLEDEARSHLKREEERKKEEEMRINLEIKEMLRVYYQKYNPEKVTEASLDNILTVYKGRVNDLNEGLATKYGTGFLTQQQVQKIAAEQKRCLDTSVGNSKPIRKVKDKYPESSKLLRLVHHPSFQKKEISNPVNNQGLEEIEGILSQYDLRSSEENNISTLLVQNKQQVALQVAPAEVLPHVCASKSDQSSPLRGKSNSHLKSFLIDSRPMAVAKSQGRFPTAASLPPETLLDPDLIQKEVDRFESFRGSVHLVVMGEGIGSIPSLYGHALTAKEQKLAQEDYSRTELCALFFIKRGFPYVSILEGGFAAAYSFLYREKLFQLSQVLVDYDENVSIWPKLEKAHENPVGEISKQITALIEGGLKRINKASAAAEKLSGQSATAKRDNTTELGPPLPSKNPFAGMSSKFHMKSAMPDGSTEIMSAASEGSEKPSSFVSWNLKASSAAAPDHPRGPWSSLNLRSKTPAIKFWNLSEPTADNPTSSSKKDSPRLPFQKNLFTARKAKVAVSSSPLSIDRGRESTAEMHQSFLGRFVSSTSSKLNPSSNSSDANVQVSSFASPVKSLVNRNSFPSSKPECSDEAVILFAIDDHLDGHEKS